MTLNQLIETLENPDMLRIIVDEQDVKDVFVGYLGIFHTKRELLEKYGEQKVQRVRAVPEIRHKKWREMNLVQPLLPEETPDFSFADLQMKLYYQIMI